MYPERFKFPEIGIGDMSSVDTLKTIFISLDKNKILHKEEIVHTGIRTGDMLRLGLEGLGRRYNKTQREIIVACTIYSAERIKDTWGQQIKDIYEKRELLYRYLVEHKDRYSYEWILANRILETLKFYVNNMENIKKISFYCFRPYYEYLGAVARALGTDFSCIARLSLYLALDCEGLLIPEGVIESFDNSLKVAANLLDYAIDVIGIER